MGSAPAVRTISIDYSDDELDAIAEAFTRRDIARRERADDAHDPVRRARNQTALRGLVARRAIALDGSPERPRMTFLAPHATLLGAMLGAGSIATIHSETRTSARTISLFVHDDVVVEQAALPGLAIQRMTAHPRAAAPGLLHRALALPASAPPPSGPDIELTERLMSASIAAFEEGRPPPSKLPPRVADILYARRMSGSVTITRRETAGTRSATAWAWIDAGELGVWHVRSEEGSPLVRLAGADAPRLTADIAAAWAQAAPAAEAPA